MRMGNNYQIEGIDNNERTGLLQILVPPIEAIQTVDVSTSNFEAGSGPRERRHHQRDSEVRHQ